MTERRAHEPGDGGFLYVLGGGPIRYVSYCILHVSCMYFDVSRSDTSRYICICHFGYHILQLYLNVTSRFNIKSWSKLCGLLARPPTRQGTTREAATAQEGRARARPDGRGSTTATRVRRLGARLRAPRIGCLLKLHQVEARAPRVYERELALVGRHARKLGLCQHWRRRRKPGTHPFERIVPERDDTVEDLRVRLASGQMELVRARIRPERSLASLKVLNLPRVERAAQDVHVECSEKIVPTLLVADVEVVDEMHVASSSERKARDRQDNQQRTGHRPRPCGVLCALARFARVRLHGKKNGGRRGETCFGCGGHAREVCV